MQQIYKILAILLILFVQQSQALDYEHQSPTEIQCSESINKKQLLYGWHPWEPYQFNKSNTYNNDLTGMDIELLNILAKNVGVELVHEKISWAQNQQELSKGKRDIALGATYTKERAKYAYVFC